jgi:chemotaxis protein MotB
MKAALIVVSILALALASATFYFFSSNKKAQQELEELRLAKDELTGQVHVLQDEKAAIAKELEAKVAELSKAKEEEIAALKGTYEALVTDMKSEIEQGQIKITQLADRLSVSMVDKILFPSGEADIMPEGVKVLQRVGNVLKNTQGKIIRVEGHTDNVPISPRLIKQFPTNWELSTTRATNVVRFLQDKVGIEAARLQAVGMSEYHPVASNATPAGRSQNRRIEIALLSEVASIKSSSTN